MSNVQEKNGVDFAALTAAADLEYAVIRSENDVKTRQVAAKEQIAAAIRDRMQEVLRVLATASYQDSRGKIVISAQEVYDSLYTSEFAGIFKSDSNTPQPWQFSRAVVGILRRNVARYLKATNSDRAKAAWRAFAGANGIGVNVESVPSTDATTQGIVDALTALFG